MIQRMLLPVLKQSASNFPVTAILGPRQVGKTTLCYQVAEVLNKKVIHLDLELPEDVARLSNPSQFFQRNKDACIMIDEIQGMPGLFPVMRAVIDKHRVPGRFIITGSASIDLVNRSSESLAGRIVYEFLSPLNLLEVINRSDYRFHWLRGGFPEPFQMSDDSNAQKWYVNFVRTYLERDLPMLGLNASPVLMYKFWTMIAHVHANIWNSSNISRSLGVSSVTISKYLDFLEHAFVVRQLRPYEANLKKRLVKAPKVYIRDSGLLHSLLQLKDPSQVELMPYVGASWEGYVIEQILQYLPGHIKPFYYRTHDGSECDLVLVKDDKPFYTIEVKFGVVQSTTKGHTVALQDLNAPHNYVIIPEGLAYPLKNGIEVMNITDFMKDIYPNIH